METAGRLRCGSGSGLPTFLRRHYVFPAPHRFDKSLQRLLQPLERTQIALPDLGEVHQPREHGLVDSRLVGNSSVLTQPLLGVTRRDFEVPAWRLHIRGNPAKTVGELHTRERTPAMSQDSSSWRANTLATEKVAPAPTVRALSESASAHRPGQKGLPLATRSISPSARRSTAPKFGRFNATPSQRSQLRSVMAFGVTSFFAPPVGITLPSIKRTSADWCSASMRATSAGTAVSSPSPSTSITRRLGFISYPAATVAATRARSTVNSSPGSSRFSFSAAICSGETGPIRVA